tara:strand:- start:108874 stop:110706 length:1833 start_codon:yes stop_codon:yes gene_type:complete
MPSEKLKKARKLLATYPHDNRFRLLRVLPHPKGDYWLLYDNSNKRSFKKRGHKLGYSLRVNPYHQFKHQGVLEDLCQEKLDDTIGKGRFRVLSASYRDDDTCMVVALSLKAESIEKVPLKDLLGQGSDPDFDFDPPHDPLAVYRDAAFEPCAPGSVLHGLLEKTSDELSRTVIKRWASGESISSISKDMGLNRSRLPAKVGLPSQSSFEWYQAMFDSQAPHLKLLEVDRKDRRNGKPMVHLRVLDQRDDREVTAPAQKFLKKLRSDPEFVFAPSAQTRQAKMGENGTTKVFGGRSLQELADLLEVSPITLRTNMRNLGDVEGLVATCNRGKTNIEALVESWLHEEGLPYVHDSQLPGSKMRPDFYLPDHNVAIECEGNYWHGFMFALESRYADLPEAEARKKAMFHHRNRRLRYLKRGIRPFFFLSDELTYKPEICRSILMNHLGKSTARHFARKLEFAELSPSFFDTNHLMGRGRGSSFGLFHQGQPVAGMQLKWKSKEDQLLEVARFSPAMGTSVVGGFSRLLTHGVREAFPSAKSVLTFIDLRYGDGSYLSKQGWVKKSKDPPEPSFSWVKGELERYARTKFRGKTGYDFGYDRLYDCGQAKWVKAL